MQINEIFGMFQNKETKAANQGAQEAKAAAQQWYTGFWKWYGKTGRKRDQVILDLWVEYMQANGIPDHIVQETIDQSDKRYDSTLSRADIGKNKIINNTQLSQLFNAYTGDVMARQASIKKDATTGAGADTLGSEILSKIATGAGGVKLITKADLEAALSTLGIKMT